jgi:DNA-binding IclR family transcriptional regulator
MKLNRRRFAALLVAEKKGVTGLFQQVPPQGGHTDDEQDDQQAGNESATKESQLLRGLRVLDKLTTEAMTASEIARYLDVNRSTSLRLLNELVEAGYVSRNGQTKKFMTRPERFYGFIMNNPAHSDLTEFINPLLKRLQEESGESVMLGTPANDGMVYVAHRQSHHHVSISERLGTWRPMYCSALGMAYLSALNQQALDVELGRMRFVGGTPRAAKGPLDLRARVDAAREQGFAVDHEETFEGGCCVAVPTSIAGNLIGAIGISGPSTRLTEQTNERLGALLVSEVGAAGLLARRQEDPAV